ncbi:MFS transporter [Thalassotalea marina]|uniref:MFS transporter n=1 Tax=Thalassotalea marina TaxID=1673741 RepID=A0A919BIP3_9GAMM|nr:MFS transporter [Thalassotalea marina]GHF91607.1 MFS transporter [Thalassotalea marina]
MRAFISLYLTNLFLVGGTGLLTTYLALYLTQHQISTFWVGLMTSAYYFGLLFGAKIGYYFIKSVGHIRTFSASTAVVIACVAMHGLTDNIYFWLVLRITVGIGMMCNYMVLESWLNEQAAPENRGRVFSMYMITSYLGMIGGQYALSQFPELGLAPLLLVCIAVSFGIVPIATTRRIHPKPLKPVTIGFFSYFKEVPQSLTAVLCAGIINGSFYGLAPVFAKESGFSTNDIALFMSLTIGAGLLAQWPMGILSDKFKRSVLIRINTVFIGAISLFMALNSSAHPMLLVATFTFGLFAFTLYPLSSALANSRITDEYRVGVSSALLMAFGIGAAIGLSVIAQLMEMVGHQALYGAISALTVFMFALLTGINSIQKREKPKESDYVVTPSDITASPLAASMDPRIEESTAQEQLLVSDDEEIKEDIKH